MFYVDEDKTIHLTRGDYISIAVNADTNDETPYTFKPGDIIRLRVCERKHYENVLLQKDVEVTEELTTVDIQLTRDETKIGELINKPVDYWYEVELNPNTIPHTIIGYDADGAKIFRLYPEGGDIK